MAEAGSRWRIAEFRPGGAPLRNLARGLLQRRAKDPRQQAEAGRRAAARAPRARPALSHRMVRAVICRQGTNLLLLVDQFEELFRYQLMPGARKRRPSSRLLLESARAQLGSRDLRRHHHALRISRRRCLIDGLAEAINRGLFLTPRMTREQCRDAIVGPAAVCGFEIEPALGQSAAERPHLLRALGRTRTTERPARAAHAARRSAAAHAVHAEPACGCARASGRATSRSR